MARAEERVKSGYDTTLLLSVFTLVGIGLVMVYSASSAIAFKKYGSDIYFVKKQLLFAIMGVGAIVVLRRIPYKVYERLAYPILGLSVVLLFMVFVPHIGTTAGGATRWVRLGPVGFQPSEFVRLALIIYLSYSMAKKKERMKEFKVGVLPHVLVTGFFCAVLLCQPDFGSAVLLCLLAGVMLFVGGVRIKHLVILGLGALPLVIGFMLTAEYRVKRLLTFLNPWASQTEEGYQIVHSLMAFGTGGIYGVGIGNGYQKLFYLPEPHTDFVFSVLGEELGLWGVFLVVALFCLVIWRGLALARRVSDPFGAYLATGCIVAIGLQAAVNMCVAMGMLPTKGLTLPFLSYGGTSLLFSLVAVGILTSITAGFSQKQLRSTNVRNGKTRKRRPRK